MIQSSAQHNAQPTQGAHMTNKHTPGPWKFDPEDDSIVGSNEELSIATIDNFDAGGKNGFHFGPISSANARLIAAAPELLEAQTMGASFNTPDFLDWIADRLVNVHGESPNVDYVLSLRDRAKLGRAAIAKATGEAQ